MPRRERRRHIAIEARAFEFDRPRNTGIGNYVAGVLGALGEVDDGNRYSVVTVAALHDSVRALAAAPNIDLRTLRLPPRAFAWLRRHRRLPPIDLLMRRTDAVLFTNFTTYPLLRTPFSLIIYDLSFVIAPDTVQEGYRNWLVRNVPRSIERAGSIVVPSESVRAEVLEHYPAADGKIVVASPGVDRATFRPTAPEAQAAARARFGLPDRYFLFVGTLQPRKNLLRLLAAYRALAPEVREREALVLVGMKGWRDDSIRAELEQLSADGVRVHWPGYVATTDLPALYSGATALVWPSLYEGFGMPILEAMACGAPVITSDCSSMPEAAGGAALLVDPTDVDALSAAMLRVSTDDALARELTGRGRARAARANWRDTASRVLEALEIAIGSAGAAPGVRP